MGSVAFDKRSNTDTSVRLKTTSKFCYLNAMDIRKKYVRFNGSRKPNSKRVFDIYCQIIFFWHIGVYGGKNDNSMNSSTLFCLLQIV